MHMLRRFVLAVPALVSLYACASAPARTASDVGASSAMAAETRTSTPLTPTETVLPTGKASGVARAMILNAHVTGAIGMTINRQMDEQARDLAKNIPDARVERLVDGILVTLFTGRLFDFDSDRVLGESERNLRALARSLSKYDGENVFIVGHTDALGTSAYNVDLSKRRARATAAYLTSQGVGLERIRTDGRGEQEPIADNSTEAGQARNRRMEIAIFASEAYRARLTAKLPPK